MNPSFSEMTPESDNDRDFLRFMDTMFLFDDPNTEIRTWSSESDAKTCSETSALKATVEPQDSTQLKLFDI